MDNNFGQTISIWMATAEEPQSAPLRENMHADVCIVGAGIAGMTTAYLLARTGKATREGLAGKGLVISACAHGQGSDCPG